MCFHAARLDSKVNENGEVIDLRNQDRNLWHFPLVRMGNDVMEKAVETQDFSVYHYEAAIAAEHLKARTFDTTNWEALFHWNEKLYLLQPTDSVALSLAMIQIQRELYEDAQHRLQDIEPSKLEQRAYLYYGTYAEFYKRQGEIAKAISCMELALNTVRNEAEKTYLQHKKRQLQKEL